MKNKQMPSFDELLEKIQALIAALIALPGFTWDDGRHPWFGEDIADAKEASERNDRSEVGRILTSLIPKIRGVGAAFVRRSPGFYEAKIESFAREIGERQDQDLVGRLKKALAGYKTFIAQLTDPIDFAPVSEAMGGMLALLTEAREERVRREKRREERLAEERAKALAAKKAVEEAERAAKEAAREEKMREERVRRTKGLESLAGLLQRPSAGTSMSV